MTGPRGDTSPEWTGLGPRLPRKDELKPEPAKPRPAREDDWSIVIGPDGKWETNIPGNDAAIPPADSGDIAWP